MLTIIWRSFLICLLRLLLSWMDPSSFLPKSPVSYTPWGIGGSKIKDCQEFVFRNCYAWWKKNETTKIIRIEMLQKELEDHKRISLYSFRTKVEEKIFLSRSRHHHPYCLATHRWWWLTEFHFKDLSNSLTIHICLWQNSQTRLNKKKKKTNQPPRRSLEKAGRVCYISSFLCISTLFHFFFFFHSVDVSMVLLSFMVMENKMCQDLLWIGSDPFRTLLLLAWFGSILLFSFADIFVFTTCMLEASVVGWFCNIILWSSCNCLSGWTRYLMPNAFCGWTDNNPTQRRRTRTLKELNIIFSGLIQQVWKISSLCLKPEKKQLGNLYILMVHSCRYKLVILLDLVGGFKA